MFVSSSTALIPGKRIKAAHRKFGAGMPLKAFGPALADRVEAALYDAYAAQVAS